MEHHARLFLADSIEDSGIDESYKKQSSDVCHVIADNLSIGESRKLILDASIRPAESSKRTFVIKFINATIEAQNALLKLFEDPPETSQFILIVPNKQAVIPTLLSRLQVENASTFEKEENNCFKVFLTSDYASRLEQIANFAKKRDLDWLSEIQGGLRYYPAQKSVSLTEKNTILLVESLLGKRGSSNKMLLEELALSLPVG